MRNIKKYLGQGVRWILEAQRIIPCDMELHGIFDSYQVKQTRQFDWNREVCLRSVQKWKTQLVSNQPIFSLGEQKEIGGRLGRGQGQ